MAAKITVLESPADVARHGADQVEGWLADAVSGALGLAAGGSVVGLYDELVSRHERGRVSFAESSAFLLDEYVGLDRSHPRSFHAVVGALFASRVDLGPGRYHGPDGSASDLGGECSRYDRVVSAAAIGLQLLGIGRNGHIGFNEPGSSFSSRTRVVSLDPGTRHDNARFFDSMDEVPTEAITQGIGTILEADRLVLVAFGEHKAPAIRAALEGPITPGVPASAIRLHPSSEVIVDRAAASQLAR